MWASVVRATFASLLFDFGLAMKLEKGEKINRLEVTRRYMAPEVKDERHYSFPADVYSFAILKREVCSLKQAYREFKTAQGLKCAVVTLKIHPQMHVIASPIARGILQKSWDWLHCGQAAVRS
jgi:serine/threonine protein kinase